MPKCAIVCCILLVIFVTTRDATFVGQCAAGDQHERGAENVSDCNLKHGKDRIESIKVHRQGEHEVCPSCLFSLSERSDHDVIGGLVLNTSCSSKAWT